eukprot:503037-Rhodomonas_salina.1
MLDAPEVVLGGGQGVPAQAVSEAEAARLETIAGGNHDELAVASELSASMEEVRQSIKTKLESNAGRSSQSMLENMGVWVPILDVEFVR